MNQHASFNRIFRLIWSERLQTWVVAAEDKKSRRKGRGRSARAALTALAAHLGLGLAGVGWAQTAPPPALQLPVGGQVRAGQATITQSTTAQAAQMTVQQTSARAAIEWQGFDVGAQARVQFQQPNAQAVTLNRVVGTAPSQIFGQISAPGQVYVLNPQGVLFGKGASVDVGGLVATTHALGDADFMAGRTGFDRQGATGRVVNAGELRAALGGYIALLAPEVRNEGLVVAQKGTVAFGAGERVTLNFGAGGALQGIAVDPGALRALIDNRQAVEAPGGQVIFSALAAQKLMGSVIQAGRIDAASLVERGGRVLLEAGEVTLATGSVTDASGATGGGTVHVGGGWQGSGNMAQAERVRLETDATVRADATRAGPGGEVVLWSDVHNPASVTEVQAGVLSARGAGGGAGGRIETSGSDLQVGLVRADAGQGGLWLLDPANITVSDSGNAPPAALEATLNAGSNVELDTTEGCCIGNAYLKVLAPIRKTAGGDATITMIANSNIEIGGGVGGVGITSTSGALNVVMRTIAGSVVLGADGAGLGVNIATNGGHLWIGGGAESTTPWNGLTVGTGPASANYLTRLLNGGVEIHRSSIDTRAADGSGGSIAIAAEGVLKSGATEHIGLRLNQTSMHTGSGDVGLNATLFAQTSATPAEAVGMRLVDSSITSTGGDITVSGTAGSRSSGGGGVLLIRSVLSTGAGDLTVTGHAGDINRSAWSHGVSLDVGGVANATAALRTGSGALTLTGTNGATSGTDATGVMLLPGASGAKVEVLTQTGTVTLVASQEANTASSAANQGLRLFSSNAAGVVNLGGDGASYAGGSALTIRASRIGADNIPVGAVRLPGANALSVLPVGNSFLSDLNLNNVFTLGNLHTSLTLGSATNTKSIVFSPGSTTVAGPVTVLASSGSTADITLGSALTASGGVTLDAADALTLGASLSTSGAVEARGGNALTLSANSTLTGGSGADAAVTLRSGGTVTLGTNTAIVTDGAPVTLWSRDQRGSANAAIALDNGSKIDTRRAADRAANTHTTGGGAITLAGDLPDDDGAPSGYTRGVEGFGIRFGNLVQQVTQNANVNLYSGGGDVLIRGATDAGIHSNQRFGVLGYPGFKINAGFGGDVTIDGIGSGSGSTMNRGVTLGAWPGTLAYTEILSAGDAANPGHITITGQGLNNSVSNLGVSIEGVANAEARIATGWGNVTVTATAPGANVDLWSHDTRLLSADGGSITLSVPRAGGKSDLTRMVLGSAAASSAAGSSVTASSAAVNIVNDRVVHVGTWAIDTSGPVLIKPYSTDFTDNINLGVLAVGARQPVASFSVLAPNSARGVDLDGSITATGDITLQGHQVNMQADATAGGAIALQTTRGLWFPSATRLSAGNGGITVAARAWGGADGWIESHGDLNFTTTGTGAIRFGGGDLTASGEAKGSTTSNTDRDGIRIQGNLSLSSEAGDIRLAGRSAVPGPDINATGHGVTITGATTVTSQTGAISIDGVSPTQGVQTHGAAVNFGGVANISSGATDRTAIQITGDASTAAGDNTWTHGGGITFWNANNVIAATGAGGGVLIDGRASPAAHEGVLFHGGRIQAASGPIEVRAHDGLFFGTGSAVTTLGALTGSSITASTSNVTLRAPFVQWFRLNVNTTGGFSMLPLTDSSSFGQEIRTSWFHFNETGTNTANKLSGLTIGGAYNSGDIYLDTAQTVNGPITLLAPAGNGDVFIDQNATATVKDAAILAKAGNGIFSSASRTLQTNYGAITLWADADAQGGGPIVIGSNNQLNAINGGYGTNVVGGGITLAGGAAGADGLPAGAASGINTAGVTLGSSAYAILRSGGDITVRAASSGTVAGSSAALIANSNTTELQAMMGRVTLSGTANTSNAVPGVWVVRSNFTGWGGDAARPGVSILGQTSQAGVPAVKLEYGEIAAGAVGGLVIDARAPGTNGGVSAFHGASPLLRSSGGPVDIYAGVAGMTFGGQIGDRDEEDFGSTPAAVSFHTDRFTFLPGAAVFTTGPFKVEPHSSSFAQTVTLDGNANGADYAGGASFANLTFKEWGAFGGFVIGKPGNLSAVNVVDVWNVNGDMGFYGGNVNFGGAITAGRMFDRRVDVMADRLTYQQFMGGDIYIRPTTPGTPLFVSPHVGRSAAGLELTGSLENIIAKNALVFGDATSGNALIDAGTLMPQPRLEIRTGGDLTLAAYSLLASRERLGDQLTQTRVVLDAGGRFLNLAGSGVLSAVRSATETHDWVVYSRRPDTNTFGGLSSGQTALWGTGFAQTDAAAALQGLDSGKPARYVFREPGAVTLSTTDATKTYGQTADLSGRVAYSGLPVSGASFGNAFVNSTPSEILATPPTLASTGTPAVAGVGRYAITASGAQANTGFSVVAQNTGMLTVNPASLTLTASPATRAYGDDNPPVNAQFSGFVNGENAASAGITGAAGMQAAPAVTAPVGSYALTPTRGTLAAPNYVVDRFVAGTLTITPRTVQFSGTRVYDGTRQVDGAALQIRNAVGNDCASAADCRIGGSAVAESRHVGEWGLVDTSGLSLPTTAAMANYTLVDASGTVTTTPKPVTLAGLQVPTRAYNGSNVAEVDARAAYVEGRIAGDAVSPSTVATPRFADAHVGAAKPVVNAFAGLAGADAANYTLAAQPALTGEVTPYLLSVQNVQVQDKVYDGGTAAQVVPPAAIQLFGDTVGVAATGTFIQKDVGSQVPVRLSIGLTGAAAGNYALADDSQTVGFAAITPKPLALAGAQGLTKVYDGLTTVVGATVSGLEHPGHGALQGVVAGDGVDLHGAPRFDSAQAGARTVVQGGLQLVGTDAGNYRLLWTDGSGTIQRAPLTLRANDDAKFVGQTDAANYAGVVATGLVNGETLASIGGVTITRTNSGNESSGIYDGVLRAQALDAGNYEVNPVPGRFTIVPADQLLVRMRGAEMTYGDAFVPTITEASYLSSATGQVVDLTLQTRVEGRRVTVVDGSSGQASFEVTSDGVGLSGAGHIRAGGWHLGAADVSETSPNFGAEVSVVGALQVNAKPVSINGSGVSKVYDGNTAMTGLQLSLAGALAGDQLVGHGQGAFASKNAGTGLTYQVTDLALTGADASNYQLGGTTAMNGSDGAITPRPVSASGLTAASRPYDGTTTATVDARLARLSGVVAGDALGLQAQGQFADKHVGVDKPVVLQASLAGADAGNYTLGAVSPVVATVTPRVLQVQAQAENKVYDATTVAQITVLGDDRVAGDVLSVQTEGRFVEASIGLGKPVVLAAIGLQGSDAGNYRVASPGTLSADVSPRPLTLTVSGRADKVYDGTDAVTGGLTLGLDGVLGGDTAALDFGGVLRFADKHAGVDKPVAYSGFQLTGAQAANYSLPASGAIGVATITPRLLTPSFRAADKVYDGQVTATVQLGDDRVPGDALSLSADAARFADKNAGTGKTVSVDGVAVAGADAGNYRLAASEGQTQASITPRPLQVRLRAENKVYDATTQAGLTVIGDDRIAGDTLAVQPSGQFLDRHVGQGKAVELTAIALDGADASNYQPIVASELRADVAPRALSLDLGGRADKVYDGTDAAAAGVTVALRGVQGQDDTVLSEGRVLRFADKNAGVDKPIVYEGFTLLGADAGNYLLSVGSAPSNATIAPRPLTLDLRAADKVYDGQVTASVQITDDRLAGDTLRVATTGSAFADRHAGVGKTVTVDGLALEGDDAGNYRLASSTGQTQASIAPRPLQVQARAEAKVYDGSTQASVTVLGDDRIAGDVFVVQPSGAFVDRHAGPAKAVQVSAIVLQGADAGNYSPVPLANLAADVARRTLNLEVAGSVDKVYDGSAAMPAGVNLALRGVVAGDDAALAANRVLRFADKQAGSGKALVYEGFALAGVDADNYTLSTAGAPTQGSIAPRLLTPSFRAAEKAYDGNTTASVQIADDRVPGDALTLSAAASRFADRHIGSDKPVTVEGLSLTGADATNYRLADTTGRTQASIAPLELLRWVGGPAGKASDPANWAGGALPDGRNVIRVELPPGVRVVRDIDSAATGWPQRDVPDQAVLLATGAATSGAAAGTAGPAQLSAQAVLEQPVATVGGLVSPVKPVRESSGSSGLRWGQVEPSLPAPGVYVQVLALPAAAQPGRVQVDLDFGLGTSSTFLLPDAVVQALGQGQGDVSIEVIGRARLPDWLKIDRQSLQVSLLRMPARAQPLTLKLRRGDQVVEVLLQPLRKS